MAPSVQDHSAIAPLLRYYIASSIRFAISQLADATFATLALSATAFRRKTKAGIFEISKGCVFPLKYISAALIKADVKPSSYKLTFIKSKCHLKPEQSLFWAMATGLFQQPNGIG